MIDTLNRLSDFAKKYRNDAQKSIERNRHMNQIGEGEVIQQRIIDAVLVDFINQYANKHCIDYALYT